MRRPAFVFRLPGLGRPSQQAAMGCGQVVDAEAMGRTASKVESIEELLKSLESEASGPARDLRSYFGKGESRLSSARGERAHPGKVVGQCLRKV